MLDVNHLIGRAGASPPSRATARNFYIRPTVRQYRYRNFYFTVTSHELRMRTIFIPMFHVTTLRQRSLDRGKRGALSEASTTSCQQASRLGECQGKRKAPVEAPCHCTTTRSSDWFFYYRVKEFIIFVSSFLLQ